MLALQLATLALLLNAVVPAGFMLHASHGGALTMVLCPDQGPLPGFAHADHQNDDLAGFPAAGEAGDETSCAFSLLTGPLLGSLPPAVPLSAPGQDLLPAQPHLRRAAVRHRLFSVRAPPLLS